MLGFILGLATGRALSNPSLVRHGLAVVLVAGEDAVACAARTAQRVSVQIREDIEDIIAEAQSSQEP